MAVLTYIPTNNIGGFSFFHTLSNINCLETFWWWPFWQVQSDARVQTKLLRSCPTLCYPMNCSPPSSPVYGILQVRILESAAMPSLRGIFPTLGLSPCLKSPALAGDTIYLPLEPPGEYFLKILIVFFKNLFIFNWRIIALQYCIGFCQTSTTSLYF